MVYECVNAGRAYCFPVSWVGVFQLPATSVLLDAAAGLGLPSLHFQTYNIDMSVPLVGVESQQMPPVNGSFYHRP